MSGNRLSRIGRETKKLQKKKHQMMVMRMFLKGRNFFWDNVWCAKAFIVTRPRLDHTMLRLPFTARSSCLHLCGTLPHWEPVWQLSPLNTWSLTPSSCFDM